MKKKKYTKQLYNKGYKFRFSNYQTLGAPDAEADRFLDDVFIDTGALGVLEDMDSAKCIIVGRTGSGKSALLKKLDVSERNLTRIAPESMSLKFLTNSTILDYFRGLGVKLNFFYKVLWKHVFMVEILKLYLGDQDHKTKNLMSHLWSKISTGGKSDAAKQAALKYFDQWSDEFWLKTEHRIKTLEQDLEKKFGSETGIDLKSIRASVSRNNTVTEKNTTEVKYKAEQIINEIQAEDLINLIDILSENVFTNPQKKYYILIDDLDKDWVSPQIVYDLIGAMVDVIKEFQQKFKGVKIIIALRDNIFQILFSGQEHRGGQREKYTPLFLNLTWDSNSLKELIDSRIKRLTDSELNVANIFDKTNKGNRIGIDYIIERTYLRPRDIISFFNKIIECSNNKTYFDNNLIKQAEIQYSHERLHALEDEWAENYGDISKVHRFLFGMHDGFKVSNLTEDTLFDIMMGLDLQKTFRGPLYEIFKKWKGSPGKPADFKAFISELLYIFFRIGIVGIKRKAELKPEFFYNSNGVTAGDFNKDAKIYVHKALFSALKINAKDQEFEI